MRIINWSSYVCFSDLVAAAASDDAAPVDGFPDPRAERSQCLVAGSVAVAVVDLLEQVDVDHDRGERPPRGAGARERDPAQLAHLLVVVQARQPVVLGLDRKSTSQKSSH